MAPLVRLTTLAVLATLAAACSDDTAPAAESGSAYESAAASALTPGPGEPTLDEIRAATERLRDVDVALAEGYVPDPSGMCITAEMEGRPASEGAMGIHYFRPDLLGVTGPPDPRLTGTGTHTDFRNPAILLYEPQADGSLELVAIENLVFIRSWEAAGNSGAPTFYGGAWDRMEDDPATDFDEAHGFDPHYDKHVWIYRNNPLGVFSPMNPNVTCEHAGHV